MKRKSKNLKPATIRLSDDNATMCEQISQDTGRSIAWAVNLMCDCGRTFLKSGGKPAEEIKLFLRTAGLARQAAEQQGAAVRKLKATVDKLDQNPSLKRHMPKGAA